MTELRFQVRNTVSGKRRGSICIRSVSLVTAMIIDGPSSTCLDYKHTPTPQNKKKGLKSKGINNLKLSFLKVQLA